MPLLKMKPVVAIKKGDEISISNDDLLELMQAVLATGAEFKFRAKGMSMTPFIRDGDVITLAPVEKGKPAVGRVVAFVQPQTGHLVVHRVVGKQNSKFIIQGDNTVSEPDGLLLPRDILGSVTRVERESRRVYLGLGLDGYLLAVLSRNGLLVKMVGILRQAKNWITR